MIGSELRTVSMRPVTVLRTVGTSVPTIEVTWVTMAPIGACAATGSIGRIDWIVVIAISMADVAIARHCVTRSVIMAGRLPTSSALSRLTTSSASPAPRPAMIDASSGCAVADTSSSSDVRTVRICCSPAIVGWIEPAMSDWAGPSSTSDVSASSSVSYCVPAIVSA